MEQVRLAITLLIALFLITSPALALTITLNYPPNNAQTIDTTPTFNFTPTGSSSSYNCTLYIDGTNYGEATNIPNNTATEITPTTALSTGDHNWNITCEGVGTTETGTSETRVIGIGENFSRCAILIDAGATYYLRADISADLDPCIKLDNDNIVLDCDNHKLNGGGSGTGIRTEKAGTIRNCWVDDFAYNIYLKDIDGVYVLNTTSVNATWGINFYNATAKLENVHVENNWENFDFPNARCHGTEFINVTGINNLPVLYYNYTVTIENRHNDLSEIILCEAHNSVIRNVTIDHIDDNSIILFVIRTQNSTFEKLHLSNGTDGMVLMYSSNNNTVKDSVFDGHSFVGIRNLHSSAYNTYENLSFLNNNYGISFEYTTSHNALYNSTCRQNNYCIEIEDGPNTFANNIIIESNSYGVYLYSGTGNVFYNNYFNNTNNLRWGSVYANVWNVTKQLGSNIVGGGFIAGNFWAKPDGTGFSQTCNDTNIDGICDDPYSLETNNIDYLPLSPYYDGVPPEITFLTAGAHSPGSVTVKFEAEDNVVNCTLEIDGVSYSLYRDGNIFWTNYTLTKGVMAVATCWDSADWRINNTTASAAYFLAGGVGGMGGGPVPVLRTHYSLSFTIATPTPATIYIYTPDGELVKKLEDVSGFSHTYLPKGDYVIKVVTEGRVRTYEITLDRPKAIAITPQTTPFLTWDVILGLLALFVLLVSLGIIGFLIGYKEKKKR